MTALGWFGTVAPNYKFIGSYGRFLYKPTHSRVLEKQFLGEYRIFNAASIKPAQGNGSNAPNNKGVGSSNASKAPHMVQRGENLSQIAKKNGVSVRDLCQANSITDPNKIKVRQRLKIPR